VGVRYTIDKQRRLIVIVAEGPVVFDDIRCHQDRLLADPEFDANFDQLIDTTPATKVDLSAEEARILAERRILSPIALGFRCDQAVHVRPGADDRDLS
jgi:hypothetical protein